MYNFFAQKKSAHIYTLGIVDDLRGPGGAGFARKFFDKFVQMLNQDPAKLFGLIQLEVVAYNRAGINFYRKCGMKFVRFKEQHYNIFDMNYSAVEVVKYLNGFEPSYKLKRQDAAIESKVFTYRTQF